jgi:hypothetical protein
MEGENNLKPEILANQEEIDKAVVELQTIAESISVRAAGAKVITAPSGLTAIDLHMLSPQEFTDCIETFDTYLSTNVREIDFLPNEQKIIIGGPKEIKDLTLQYGKDSH